MLPVALRFSLRTDQDFFDQARRKRLPHLLVFFRREAVESSASSTSPSHSPTRFAIIVKKSHGNAVERSKFKRTLRAAIIDRHRVHPQLFALPYSVVLLPLGTLQPKETYEQEIQKFLESPALRPDSAVPAAA